jgi:hypothetical protein
VGVLCPHQPFLLMQLSDTLPVGAADFWNLFPQIAKHCHCGKILSLLAVSLSHFGAFYVCLSVQKQNLTNK